MADLVPRHCPVLENLRDGSGRVKLFSSAIFFPRIYLFIFCYQHHLIRFPNTKNSKSLSIHSIPFVLKIFSLSLIFLFIRYCFSLPFTSVVLSALNYHLIPCPFIYSFVFSLVFSCFFFFILFAFSSLLHSPFLHVVFSFLWISFSFCSLFLLNYPPFNLFISFYLLFFFLFISLFSFLLPLFCYYFSLFPNRLLLFLLFYRSF